MKQFIRNCVKVLRNVELVKMKEVSQLIVCQGLLHDPRIPSQLLEGWTLLGIVA
jgi:hypothetical protein